MINHVRTFLLNTPRTADATALPDYEHIPANFVPRPVSAAIRDVRRILFGNSPDSTMLHVRGAELLRCLHASPLEPLVYATDARVTYLPFADLLRDDRKRVAVVTPVHVASNQELSILGDRSDSFPPLRLEWSLTVLDSSNVLLATLGGEQETVGYTITDNLSSTISLPGSDLSVRFTAGVGARWNIVSVARPRVSLSAALDAIANAIPKSTVDTLFSATTEEVRETWDSGSSRVHLAAAVSLAVATATEFGV